MPMFALVDIGIIILYLGIRACIRKPYKISNIIFFSFFVIGASLIFYPFVTGYFEEEPIHNLPPYITYMDNNPGSTFNPIHMLYGFGILALDGIVFGLFSTFRKFNII